MSVSISNLKFLDKATKIGRALVTTSSIFYRRYRLFYRQPVAWIFLIGSFQLFPVMASAQNHRGLDTESNKINTRELVIEYPAPTKGYASDEQRVQVANHCKRFAKNFKKNMGLWSTGPFVSVKCVERSDLSLENKSSKIKPVKSATWVLTLSRSETGAQFKLKFYGDKLTPMLMAEQTVSEIAEPTVVLENERLAKLLALKLCLSLPMRSIYQGSKVKLGATFTAKLLDGVESNVPEELYVFDLTIEDGVLFPRMFARMTLQSQTDGKAIWEIKEVFRTPKKGLYFLQQVDDRTKTYEELSEKINQQEQSFVSMLLSTGKSAFLGMRYGFPFLGGEGAFAKTPLYGYFGEFRSGLLSGLKINADVLPARRADVIDNLETYQSSKVQLGFSQGFSLDNPNVNWIDITPRLGIQNMRYSLRPLSDNGDDPAAFEMKNSPTVGAEFGIESRQFRTLFRAWMSGNFAKGITKVDNDYIAKSFRVGLDLYQDMFRVDKAHLTLLAFSAYDSTTIENTRYDNNDDINTISRLDFLVIYLGGGLTLRW